MKTKNQLKIDHDDITKRYYKDKTMSKADFESAHHDIMVQSKDMQPPHVPTDIEKLVDYAKIQGWI